MIKVLILRCSDQHQFAFPGRVYELLGKLSDFNYHPIAIFVVVVIIEHPIRQTSRHIYIFAIKVTSKMPTVAVISPIFISNKPALRLSIVIEENDVSI